MVESSISRGMIVLEIEIHCRCQLQLVMRAKQVRLITRQQLQGKAWDSKETWSSSRTQCYRQCPAKDEQQPIVESFQSVELFELVVLMALLSELKLSLL